MREKQTKGDELLAFPGLVDTHTLRAGEWVGDLPFFNLEYGINDNLSVGSNLLVDLTSVSGLPSLHTQLRYRFYESGGFKTVIDLMLVGTSVEDPDTMQRVRAGLAILGSNTSLRLDKRSQVTAGVKVGRALFSSTDPDAPEGFKDESSLSLVTLSLAYERRVSSWLHLQAAGLMLPLLSGEVDSSVASGTLDLGASIPLASRTLVRLMLNMSAGRWLFSVGGITSVNGSGGSPWFGIARKWN